MAKVTDIQDKNGATREIQDKDLANRTSQSSIASSDYVLLEDTNGAYHKIAKASFTEAVRGALGSVINSVAKGTDIAKVPVLDSNNDLGMGTLSNLASVLGGVSSLINSSISLDDCTSPGVYYWENSRPTGATQDYCYIKVFKVKGDIIIQEEYSYTVGLPFIRTRKKDGNAFSEWQSRPYFLNAYSDLSSLASALGVPVYDTITDINSINRSHIICGIFEPSATGNPFTGHYGSLYFFPSGENVGLMIIVDSSTFAIKYRLYDSGWKEWQTF